MTVKERRFSEEDQDSLPSFPPPISGNSYHSSLPDRQRLTRAFVTVGTSVESDTVVCIIEAMKLMNEIQAGG